FVDADDFVNEDYISLMVEHMERENADVVSSQHNNIEESKSIKIERNVYGLFDKERIKELLKTKYLYDKSSGKTGITVYLCTKLIKREFAEETLKAGLGLWYGEDQVGVTSLLLRINSLYVSRDYSYNYVIHTGQVTKKIDSSIWQAQTDCWQRIIDLDKECLLKEQLPLRMMLNINGVLGRMFKAGSSFKEFSSQMKLLRESPVMSILFKKKSIDLKYNLKILFYLMKFRLYLAEYIFLKITK
ncbi:MAG: glycosyltransferase, partial [Bacteroidales bacterium]|nr:glycosyltransferase [Bacteroidales bacterium]